MSNTVNELLMSGQTIRYHAQPEIKSQTVAEHAWGVAVLILQFYPESSKELLAAAIVHDCGEAGVGDIPSPTKAKAPGLRDAIHFLEHERMLHFGVAHFEDELTQEARIALKICDILEGLQYTAKNVRRYREGYRTLKSWIAMANALPLNSHQKRFVNDIVWDLVEERV